MVSIDVLDMRAVPVKLRYASDLDSAVDHFGNDFEALAVIFL